MSTSFAGRDNDLLNDLTGILAFRSSSQRNLQCITMFSYTQGSLHILQPDEHIRHFSRKVRLFHQTKTGDTHLTKKPGGMSAHG